MGGEEMAEAARLLLFHHSSAVQNAAASLIDCRLETTPAKVLSAVLTPEACVR
jgi:hypothetical protein